SPLQPKYAAVLDRESAYEKLTARLPPPPAAAPPPSATPGPKPKATPKAAPKPRVAPEEDSNLERMVKSSAFKSFARSAATVLGREITRGVFGTRRR
ncbi:MAG: helicase HerA-like domain-containing protein, partial [Pseudonocardiales bacterium]